MTSDGTLQLDVSASAALLASDNTIKSVSASSQVYYQTQYHCEPCYCQCVVFHACFCLAQGSASMASRIESVFGSSCLRMLGPLTNNGNAVVGQVLTACEAARHFHVYSCRWVSSVRI